MRKSVFNIALFLFLIATPVFLVQAQTTINPSDPNGWQFTTFGTAPTTSVDANGFFVDITVATSKSILIAPPANIPLANAFPLSYEVEKLSGPGSTTWYVNFYVDLDGNGTCDKRFDFAPNQAVGVSSFNVIGLVWDQRSTCFGANVSQGLADMATVIGANPNARLIYAAFNMGDSSNNYVGWSGYLRGITIAGVSYVLGPNVASTGDAVVLVRRPLDNRINNYDAATPIAAYGLDFGTAQGLIIYEIGSNSSGFSVMIVDSNTIAAVPEFPETNRLIAQTTTDNLVIYFWRLTSGEFQINVIQPNGKMYVLIFNQLVTGGAGYTSFEYTME